MAITEKLKIEKTDSIGTLILNQANKRNAISFEMWRDFPKAMAKLEADPDVRVIVLTGAGDKAFSAGADISEFGEYRSTPKQRALYSEYEHATTSSLRNSPKFVIARIDGVCVGGGAEVAGEEPGVPARARADRVGPEELGGHRHPGAEASG